MPAHISLITLGVADVAKATAFYEQLGFVRSKTASQESVSFFQAGPVVLALWGRDEQRDDAEAADLWTGNGGIVVAQNVAERRCGRCHDGASRSLWRTRSEASDQDILGRL